MESIKFARVAIIEENILLDDQVVSLTSTVIAPNGHVLDYHL